MWDPEPAPSFDGARRGAPPTALAIGWSVLRRRATPGGRGITPDRPVTLYCTTARRLSFVYAVLCEPECSDVAVYEDGSDGWARYGSPLERTV